MLAPAPRLRPTWRHHYHSAMEFLLDKIKATKNNADLFDSMCWGGLSNYKSQASNSCKKRVISI